MTRTTLAIVTLAAIALVLPVEPIYGARLGPGSVKAAISLRWLMLAMIPDATYLVLWGPLEEVKSWPHNSINLWLALVVATVPCWILGDKFDPRLTLVAGLGVLGAGSWLSWGRSLDRLLARGSR